MHYLHCITPVVYITYTVSSYNAAATSCYIPLDAGSLSIVDLSTEVPSEYSTYLYFFADSGKYSTYLYFFADSGKYSTYLLC